MSKIYFKGLDGLRGIAAILVVLGHVELVKKSCNFYNVYDEGGPFFLNLGSLAVTFFFVLSGFLITFLLLNEKQENGVINIKNFYLRRILRIWPVYYVLFILGFLVLPQWINSNIIFPKSIESNSYWNSFLFNLVLLPNFAKVSNPIGFQSWSIGVEEQFYIFWPILIYKINTTKKLLITMLIIIVGIYFLRCGMYINTMFELNMPILNSINKFFGESRFDNMAIGGILAIFKYNSPKFKMSIYLKIIVGFSLMYILYKQTSFGFGLDNIVAAIVFAIMILWVVGKIKFILLDLPISRFLGKISYGIYMYHVIAIFIALNIVKFIYPEYNGNGLQLNLILYSITLIITILISFGSYYYIEKWFLKFRA